MAVAVSASEPKVVSIEDSIYAFLKKSDMTLYKHHLDFLKEVEIPVLIDKTSLFERGLTEENLVDGVTITEHKEILIIISEANVTLTF